MFFLLILNSQLVAQILSKEKEEVSIYLGWYHQFQFAGYYAAVEQGYFDDVGLKVKLIPATGEKSTEAIASGKYNYGVATGATILSDRNLNKLSVIAAIMQQSPVSLITLKSREISSLQDLNNSDIVGSTEISAMLISAGVDINSVRFHGMSSNFDDLISGKYDAISYFITDRAVLLGNDSLLFKIYRPIEYGINFYGECLFTSRREVENHPERVEKIKNAVIKGWEYAVNNPKEIIDVIRQKYNFKLSEDELLSESEIIIHSLILPKFYDVGDMQKSKWEQMLVIIQEFGVIEHVTGDISGFIYISPFNDSGNVKRIMIISSLAIVIVGSFLILLMIYNRQLKKAVNSRTNSLKKANEELDRFVYSVSHDIRSPLSSIQGLISVMKLEPKETDKYIELIESRIIKLDDFTKDILDYTRNSRTDVKSEPVVLAELIDKCIEQITFSAETKGIVINKEILFEDTILSDAWRLEVILCNLLSNSVRYSDKDKLDSYITINTSKKPDAVHISISDNGIGITAEHIDKIFNMFYRASEDSQGSGLGLYIVKETVKLIGGSIDIQSKEKKGTTVIIKLPS